MLPNRQRRGVGWEPPAPLILAAWWNTTDAEKRERFRLHIQWAGDHGALEEVAAMIAALRREDWYTEE
jgi:hypothetical protein